MSSPEKKPSLRVVQGGKLPESPVTIEQETARWSDEVLVCRSVQHAWEQVSATFSKRYHYYSVQLQCIRCTTVKHQELDARGRITASWYTYPEGYLSGAGFMDVYDRARVRIASLERGNLRRVTKGEPPTRKGSNS